MAVVENVYVNYDNPNVLQLKDDSSGSLANADFSAVTEVELVLDNGDTYNSTDDPTLIAYDTDGMVTLTLGSAGIATGSYVAYFVAYAPAYPGGLRWQPDFTLQVGTSANSLRTLFDRVVNRFPANVPTQNFVDTVAEVARHIENRLWVLRSELLIKENAEAVLTDSATVSLSSRFLGIREHPIITYTGSHRSELTPLPEYKRYTFTSTGIPKHYEIIGTTMTLYPTTDRDVTVKFQSFQKSRITAMTDATPFGGLFDDFIADVVVRYGADPAIASVDPGLAAKAYTEVDRVAVRRGHKNITLGS